MKKFILVFLFAIISFTVYGKHVYASNSEQTVLPKVEAQGAVLIDHKTGRVLWEKASTKPLAMASTTKIMTAIIALENADRNDIVKVSKRAALSPKVKMNLTQGEEIKLDYLLYALMLQSFNDAAVAIAEHVSGSVEEFCMLMTDKAKEIGAYDTVFETPSGLDGENHHSTAYDMALIARYALENQDFVDIITTRNIVVSSNKRDYSLVNKNRLLNEVEGAKGVKTGFTGQAGHCFVGAVERNGMQLISVVLGSGWGDKGKNQKWVDTKELISYGFKEFNYQNIINSNDVAKNISIDRSKNIDMDVYFGEGLILPLSQDESNNLEIIIDLPDQVMAPVNEGDILGVAKIYIGNRLEKEIDLIASESADRHDFKTSIEKVLNNWLEMGTNGNINLELPEF